MLVYIVLSLEFTFANFFNSVNPGSDNPPVTLQSISSSLKETMNPRDIMQGYIELFI
jgi:hypothetical protein